MPADTGWPPDDPLPAKGLIDEWREDDRVVIGLYGEHDMSTEAELVSALASSCGPGGVGDVIVDLSRVTFIDSFTIVALLGARNCMQRHQRRLVLRAPPVHAGRVLEMCGLDVVPAAPDVTTGPAGATKHFRRSFVVPGLRRGRPSHLAPLADPADPG